MTGVVGVLRGRPWDARPWQQATRAARQAARGAAQACLVWAELTAVLVVTRLAFGGEDPLEDADDFDNWHHRGISYEAAVAADWQDGAAKEMSWHADFVDSYLYNPLWWAQGGLGRIKTALSLAPALTNVHFDDLTSAAQVQTMWRRYLSGAVAGVAWAHRAPLPAAERVAAARHIVGVALHAAQDFYSHSNWVDERSRRDRLWSELTRAEQTRTALFTGTYEHDEHTGIKHHGKYSVACSLLRPVRAQMEIVCHGVSPFSNTSVCQVWRSCDDAVPVGSFEVRGVPVPAGLVYLDPPGIALDSTWLARIGAQQRGFHVSESPVLFGAARALAVRESTVLLDTVAATMRRAGAGEFWRQVQSAPVSPERTWHAQFEDFSRQGLHFVSTGTYPPAPATPPLEWFLRLRITTADTPGAGTDADIFAGTPFGETLLDTMAARNPLIAYNDFESGDDQVFHIGPFPDLPPTLWLRNDSAHAGEVLVALGRAFVAAVEAGVRTAADFLLSLIGGHADHVATTSHVWTPAQLTHVSDRPAPFHVQLRGGSEGWFRVEGTIWRTSRRVTNGRPVSDYAVQLDRLHCLEESDVDRGTTDDEPFLFAMLVNQASRTMEKRSFGPFQGVDKGEWRPLSHRFTARDVPDGVGYLSLPLQLMESDDEGSGRRREAFAAFTRAFEERTEQQREGFIAALGRAVAAEWDVAGLEVFAYGTGSDQVRAGTVLARTAPGRIGGDERRTFTLDRSRISTIDIVRAGRLGPDHDDGPQRARRCDLDGSGASDVLVHSPWGLGALTRAGTGLTSLAMAPNGTRFGGWLLNTADNRFGPVADLDGDGRDEFFVTSPWGLGVLAGAGESFRGVMLAANGTRSGGWLFNTADDRLGPVGDFDGDGRDEVLITSPWGLGVLELDGTALRPVMMAPNGTRSGGWLLDTADDRLGPVGDFDGDGRDEVLITSPWGLGILELDGTALRPVMMAPNGTRFGGWLLNTRDDRVRAAAAFVGGGDDLFITSPWGIGVLSLAGGALTSTAMAANGTRIDGWVVNSANDQYVQFADMTGDGAADVLMTSPWGAGILSPRAGGFRVPFLAPNGTRLGGWLLDTRVTSVP